MKKYMFVMGALVLTACHDGGGHHHDYDIVPEPTVPAVNMPTTVQTWGATNATGVAVAVAGDDTDDVFKFTLDNNGAITSVNLDNREYARDGNANTYVNTDGNKTRTLNLATLGAGAGLRYADFGYAMEVEQTGLASTERDFYVFAGGDDTRVQALSGMRGATYAGTAVAYIEMDSDDRVANQISKTDDAKLVVDGNGNQTMSMNFSVAANPWYDVTITNGVIALSGGDNVADDFRVDGMVKDSQYTDVKAYGDTSADEVTYRAGAEYKDLTTGREVDFDAAFGGVRQ